jgi:hypothetical protein
LAQHAPWEERPAVAEEPPKAEPPEAETLSLFSEDQLPTIQEPPLPVPVVEETPEEEEPETAPEPEPEVKEEPEAEAEPPLPAVDPQLWPHLILEVREKKRLLSSWVESGAFLGIENGVCTLAFPEGSGFVMESLDKPSPRQFLEETLSRLAGQPITLKLELRPGVVVKPVELPQQAQKPVVDPMEEYQNDPLIRHALELFKAEIKTA